MSHDNWREWLDPYIDSSCLPEEAEAIEDHLANCPTCATDALGRLQMKIATRGAAAGYYQPSPEFRKRVEGSIHVNHTPIWKAVWGRIAATALAVVVVILISAFFLHRHKDRSVAETQLLDVHVATTASANPVDIASADPHTVQPWFQGKLPYSFVLPDLINTPYKIIGGRLVYFRHNSGAQVLFDLHKHEISAFILQDLPGVTPQGSGISRTRDKGFSIETWSQAGLRYIVIGDTSPSDVHDLCELLRAAERQ